MRTKIGIKSSLLLKSVITILISIILYWQDFVIIANEAMNSELSTHIIALPFILGYIVYRLRYVIITSSNQSSKNPLLLNSVQFDTLLGVLFFIIAYLIRWYGSYSFMPLEYHIASLPIFVAGLILILFNVQTLRILIFPVFFLFFIIPPPIEQALRAGAFLSIESAQVSYHVLRILGLPVNLLYQFGTPIISLITANGSSVSFIIDTACSGLYSQIGLMIFATFIAYISKGSLIRKIIVFSMGFPIIYALNILRIVLTVLIGYFMGLEQALKIFHLFGGWFLLFIGTLIILNLAEKIFKISIFRSIIDTCTHEIRENQDKYCLQCGKVLKTHYDSLTKTESLKIIALLLVTFYLLSIQVPVFSLTSGHAGVFYKNPSGEETTKNVLPDIEGYKLNFVYRDTEFEKISGQNASLMYQYIPNIVTDSTIWVGIEISPIKGNCHPWEVCLISWPEMYGNEVRVDKIDLRDIHLLDNPPLSARYFAFSNINSETVEVILYWYSQSVFKTDQGYEKMWSKISVIEYAETREDYKASEENILPMAEAIVDYWHPISTWSAIGMTIARQGLQLIFITGIIIATTIIFGIFLHHDRGNKAKQLHNQIQDYEDRSILDSFLLSKNVEIMEPEIASKYEEITGISIDRKVLHNKLKEADRIGIIARVISNIDDKPYIKWKLNYSNPRNSLFKLPVKKNE